MNRWSVRCLLGALVLLLLFAPSCSKKPADQMPVDETGSPILVDIGNGQFKLSMAYYELALNRVAPLFRGQFSTPEGKRDYLERLVYEGVYYLEGKRRKYDKKVEFKNTYNLRLYQGVLDEYRADIRKKTNPTDEQIQAEYDRTMKGKPYAKPLEQMKTAIRNSLIEKITDETFLAKREALMKEWQVKLHTELLDRLLPGTKPEDMPRLEEPLAEGLNGYKYTVGQLAKRIEESPPSIREKLREPGKMQARLEFVVGDDVLFTWAVREGYDKTAGFQLRKLMTEVIALSQITRKEILGTDVVATLEDAKKYYKDNPKKFDKPDGSQVPFEEVKDRVMAAATNEKQMEAMKSLAKSLMAHRFPTVNYEANIKKFLIGATDARQR